MSRGTREGAASHLATSGTFVPPVRDVGIGPENVKTPLATQRTSRGRLPRLVSQPLAGAQLDLAATRDRHTAV